MKSCPSSVFSFSITEIASPNETKVYLVRRTLKRNAQVLAAGTARVDILLARQKAKEEEDLQDSRVDES